MGALGVSIRSGLLSLAPGFASLGIGIGAERLPLRQQIRRIHQGGNFGDVRLRHSHKSKVTLPLVDHGNDLEDVWWEILLAMACVTTRPAA